MRAIRAWLRRLLDRTTDPTYTPRHRADVCEQCNGTGVVECWNPGGPCPTPNDPACETCGPCNACEVHDA